MTEFRAVVKLSRFTKTSRTAGYSWNPGRRKLWRNGRQHPGEEPNPQKELLYEKVAEHPKEDRELYRLYFTEEYSQDEIAVMKGVSQITISKKIRRIQKQLMEACRKGI